MDALKIEILNPKAIQLIKGMQDLKLIKISEEPVPRLKKYLEKMRRRTATAPDPSARTRPTRPTHSATIV